MPFVKGTLALNVSSSAKPWDSLSSYAIRVNGNPLPSFASIDWTSKLNSTGSTFKSLIQPTSNQFSERLSSHLVVSIDSSQIKGGIPMQLLDMNKSPFLSESSVIVGEGILDINSVFMESLKRCFDSDKSQQFGHKLTTGLSLVSIKDKQLTMDVEVEVEFIMDGISPTASIALYRAMGSSAIESDERTRIEIGLKQAFIEADQDDSGFISFEEVFLAPHS